MGRQKEIRSYGDTEILARGDVVIGPGSGAIVPPEGKRVDFGRPGLPFNRIRSLVASSENVTRSGSSGTNRGRIFTGVATELAVSLAAGDKSIIVTNDILASGDILLFESEDSGGREWMQVTSAASASGDYFAYSVTRDLAGTGALVWYAGTSIANTGGVGDYFLDLHGGANIGMESGPGFTFYRRYGSDYNHIAKVFQVTGAKLVIGEVRLSTSPKPWLEWTELNGFTWKVRDGASERTIAEIDEDGIFRVLDSTGSKYLFIADPTSDGLGFFDKEPTTQPSGAGQAAVTPSISDGVIGSLTAPSPVAFNNTDGEISGLPISATYDQAELQALRDKCEELADDCRALRSTVASQATIINQLIAYVETLNDDHAALSVLVHAQRTALVDLGLIKGGA